MRIALAALAALSLVACSKNPGDAAAPPAPTPDQVAGAPQADPAANGNPAVKDAHMENAGPLAAGANSFTEDEARKHLENAGYAGVSALVKDESGVWHGTGMKDGAKMSVTVDFKGNIVTK